MRQLIDFFHSEKNRLSGVDISYSEKMHLIQYKNGDGTMSVVLTGKANEEFYFKKAGEPKESKNDLGFLFQQLRNSGKTSDISDEIYSLPHVMISISQDYRNNREVIGIDKINRKLINKMCKRDAMER